MGINRDCLGKEYGPLTMAVDQARISAYADATSDPSPAYRAGTAPPVFGIVPVWPLIQEILADGDVGIDPGRVVHGEQRMRFARPIRAGDVLTSTAHLAAVDERGSNEYFTMALESRDADDAVVTSQDVVCVSRGSGAGPDGTRSRASAAADPPTPQPPVLVRHVELPTDITYRYAEASGDDNQIHVDDEFARSMGLPGIIVHGMCMFSIALQGVIDGSAGGRPERLAAASVRFRRPVRPGDTLETSVFADGDGTRFESRTPGGDPALTGTAETHPT